MNSLFKSKSKELRQCGVYLIKIAHHYYVGSSLDIYSRLSQHARNLQKEERANSFMIKCFRKYGKEACFYSVLQYCSAGERLEKELYWIKTMNPDLNMELDPTTQQNSISSSKPVYQYSLEGNFIAEYPSASEANRKLGISGGISLAASKNAPKYKSLNGFVWSYEKVGKIEYINNSAKAKIKAVTMYGNDGYRICRFESIADAGRYLQKNTNTVKEFPTVCSSISCCIRLGILFESVYRFTYDDLSFFLPRMTRNNPISQYDKKGMFVCTWLSSTVAAKSLGLRSVGIMNVVRGSRKSYSGFVWKYPERE